MNQRTAALTPFLDRLKLRSKLTGEEDEAILSLPCLNSETAAHRDIVRPGEKVEYACLVVQGLAGRFDQLANGHRQITALHIPGDMCDLQSAMVPVAGWGIGALSNCVIVRVPHKALLALAINYPAIAFAFWRDTIVDGSILAKWISSLGRRGARARLAHLICEMGIRTAQAGRGDPSDFDLQITQTQLADVLGLTAVHLNRTLQKLRGEGMLEVRRQRIFVPDVDALRRIAEFDEAYLLLPGPPRCTPQAGPR